MGLRGTRRAALAAVAACALGAVQLPALGASQSLQVTARVLEHARLRLVSRPAFVEVSPEDVARGFVEPREPVRVEVVSNLPRGVQLSFAAIGNEVRQARAVASQPLSVTQTGAMRQEMLAIHLRLDLAEGAAAGRHPWPVQVSMEPR